MQSAVKNLYARLENRGLKGRVVSIRHLDELRDGIVGRMQRGELDETFYRERLSDFSFVPPAELPEPRSLIVVAVPRPQTRVTFTLPDRTLVLVLPPTYLRYNRVFDETCELLQELLALDGYHAVKAALPQKLLTVRSGLADYGRNNVCYIDGFGSFFETTAFYSDLPCEEDTWREARMLKRCETCRACVIKCPTGAIPSEGFLLHAERCITFHNERSRDVPFPAYISPSAHNSLMGCMICQRFCPEDKPFMKWFGGDEQFTLDETALILQGAKADQLPAEAVARLRRLGRLDDLDIWPRNLSVFLNTESLAE